MVYSKTHSRNLHFLGGQRSMEIAVLLLLTVPLTGASPLRPTRRSQTEGLEVKGSEDTQEGHVPELRIIPFHSEDKHQDIDALENSMMAVKTRPKRAPQRGCQLGTCQLHNLANTLYQIGKTSGKDESKKAQDPQGYGR